MSALPDLEGRHVLVTGAASGIGLAASRAFARAGARLCVTDVNAAGLESLCSELTAAGTPCWMSVTDVSDRESMRALAEEVHTQAPLDVLVNNAGIGYLGPLVGSPLESWHRCVGVNLMGVVHGCHYLLPGMIAAGGPRRIVNVASAAAYAPAPNMAAYAASKAAVMNLSEVLAMELAHTQVGVTVVCPGIINTPIAASGHAVAPAVQPAQLARLREYYASRGASPEVVGACIVRAVRRGDALALPGPYARSMHYLARISRRLTRRLTLASARTMGYVP